MPAIELDYTNRDYESIRTFLIAAAKGRMPEWITAGEAADFGTLLLELYAYASDVQNYYIDRAAAEPFLASAQRRLSVLSIADMLGYRPIAQQAATGTVTFTLAVGSDPVTIPAITVLHTTALREEDAIFFETVRDVSLPTDDDLLTVTVGINEGRTINDEFLTISNGAPLQSYVLYNSGVIQRSLAVTVVETDGATVVWSFVDRIVDAGPDAAAYTTYVDEQKFLHVLFGDNVAGRIPPVGAQVLATYRYGDGVAGNVAPNTIVEFEDPITDVSVTNALVTFGGADDESIDSMRYSIPRAVKMRDRAITIQDFADLTYQVPGVAKAAAEGLFYTSVTVRIAPVGGAEVAPDDLKGRVQHYLEQRILVGTSVVIADPLWVDVQVTMVVHVQPQYGRENTRAKVDEAIKTLFAFDNVGFSTLVSIGEVYRTAMNIVGVDYIDLTILHLAGSLNAIEDIVTDAKTIPRLEDADRVITAVGGIT